MALAYVTTLRNAMLDEITTAIGSSGLLRIYDGTRPATGGAATTLLAELALSVTAAPGAAFSGQTNGAGKLYRAKGETADEKRKRREEQGFFEAEAVQETKPVKRARKAKQPDYFAQNDALALQILRARDQQRIEAIRLADLAQEIERAKLADEAWAAQEMRDLLVLAETHRAAIEAEETDIVFVAMMLAA